MSGSFEERARALVVGLGLAEASQIGQVRPLTGGVASDIGVVELPSGPVAVKFALPKLRVEADWRAPVHRNAAEYAWLSVAGAALPGAAPRLFGHSPSEHGFAMEFLAGDDTYLWKTAMLAGEPPRGEAALVGEALGRIHAASTRPGFDAAPFDNAEDFRAIRLEPYLSFTATRHPVVAGRLEALAEALFASRSVLVHGDVSPKNILLRGGKPVLLDAECATMGDPCFDLAFCLNHLCLKALHVRSLRSALLEEIGAFWRAYRPHVTWEDAAALEARTCALLPALMLARVDGKSPVEYLDAREQAKVRAVALPLIADPRPTLAEHAACLRTELETK
jgi:aminoglycoside phosphotransferase (APT) family kinase protein